MTNRIRNYLPYVLFLGLFWFSVEMSASCRLPHSAYKASLLSDNDRQKVYHTFKTHLAIFNQQYNLFNPVPFVRELVGASDHLDQDRAIDDQAFTQLAKKILDLILAEPSVMHFISLNEFASLIKQVLLFSSMDDGIQESLNCLFVSEFNGLLFSYMRHRAEAQERYQRSFHENPHLFREHLFYDMLRLENDILYLSTVVASTITSTPARAQGNRIMLRNLEELVRQSTLRIVLTVSFFMRSHSDAELILSTILDEDKRLQNQSGSIDFDFYGRYGQAGQVVSELVKFLQKLKGPDWSESRTLFLAALTFAHTSLARLDYQSFLKELNLLRVTQGLNGFETLLRRDNFAMN